MPEYMKAPKHAGKYIPRKSIEQIYNEYRNRFTSDAYGKWPTSYRNQLERHRMESFPRTSNPEYDNGNHTELNRPSKNEIDVDKITQTIKQRIESFNEFAQQDTPRRLPTIELGEKTFFFDGRLWELRNVENPHDRIDLRELEFGSREQLPVSEREQKEQQHEIQPYKASEIQAAQNKVETSPKTEPHQETKEKPNELQYEKLGSPEYYAMGRADITRSDISVRRKPGFDPLETGW